MGLVALQLVRFSQTGDRICVSCIGRRTLYQGTTREALVQDLRPGLPLSVPSPRCGRHCHCHTPVPRRGPRQLHLQHLCPALQHSLREWYQGHGPGEAQLAELEWVQVLGTRAFSERNRPVMAVGARWGLNLPLLTPLIRNSSSATWPWDGVWTSRLLPEGEPVGLSKVFSPFLGETSS